MAGTFTALYSHLVSLPPKLAPSVHIRALKSKSSRWLKENSANVPGFAWQEGSGAFTVSLSNPDNISALKDRRKRE